MAGGKNPFSTEFMPETWGEKKNHDTSAWDALATKEGIYRDGEANRAKTDGDPHVKSNHFVGRRVRVNPCNKNAAMAAGRASEKNAGMGSYLRLREDLKKNPSESLKQRES